MLGMLTPVIARSVALPGRVLGKRFGGAAVTCVVAALLAMTIWVLSTASGFAEDAVSLRLNWYLGGVHAPFFLGKERGFYKDAGLDLTINEGRGSANTAQVVAAGTDTFGLADSSSVMRLVSKDAPIRTVMSLLN